MSVNASHTCEFVGKLGVKLQVVFSCSENNLTLASMCSPNQNVQHNPNTRRSLDAIPLCHKSLCIKLKCEMVQGISVPLPTAVGP